MAVKLAKLITKDGDVYHFETSIQKVVGLSAELAGKQGNLTQAQLDAANSGATSELIGKITTNESGIAEIGGKIPAQATNENQLADKNFVNSSINSLAADFISYDANNGNFPTKAALLSSTTWYKGGAAYVPQKNDYLVVLADESEGGKQTRYLVIDDFSEGVAPAGKVQLQYVVNDAPFTAAQNAAIDSGITAELVGEMSNFETKDGAAVKYATKAFVEGLGTVRVVANGTDLSGFGDNDVFIELD